MVSITIKDLYKSFGDYQALQDIDLTIGAGEIFFLLGPSGCGKTTLLRHIAGFYKPDRGQILFDDMNVTNLPPRDRNTAMMFQSYALWPHMDVAKNVAFGLEQRGVDWREIETRVTEALETVQMRDQAHKKINQLSGGQQQRVALARALVVRPRCLLLDEPLSNLDAKLRLEMRGEIRRVCKEFGLTAIYVTHDQKEALSIADRMAIMKAGELLQVGTPLEIYRQPRLIDVATFIGEANIVSGRIEEIDAISGDIQVATDEGMLIGHAAKVGQTLSKGQSVFVCIRPECLQPSESPSRINCIKGKVEQKVYLGEVAQYQIRGEGGALFTCSELNPLGTRADEGETLYASVNPEDIMILTK